MKVFKCGKYSLKLGKKTYVMGILNVTPDSFSDGGKYIDTEKAIQRALEIEKEGADIIDIGAQSTRPGYSKISPDDELKRIIPVLKGLKGNLHIPISVDTFYAKVADEVLGIGVDVINDVYGFEDENMFRVCKDSDCGMVITYGFECPEKMRVFFENKVKISSSLDIDSQRICFDPGIGFSKSYEEDLDIIKNVNNYKMSNNAFLVGVSRKRVVGCLCDGAPVSDRFIGSVSAGVVASIGGADILRVHDVKETVQALKVSDRILKGRRQKGGQDNYKRT